MINTNRQIYLIKDLSFLTGLSIHTIKYYLKLGLLKETGRTPKSNFRYFDNLTLKTLNFIREERIKGNSLNFIKAELSKEKNLFLA